jgi:hypothetical protein
MAKARRQISLRRTLLIIVEGETEFAFCRYLKATLSRGRDLQVNIKSAHGGSPDAVVEYARRQLRQFPHDHLAILFDTDLPLKPKGEQQLRSLKAQTFRFSPCIEGFFLEVLGHPNPGDTAACKDKFHRLFLDQKVKLSHEAYEQLFPASAITRWRQHPDFDRLVRLFENRGGVA